MQPPKRVFLGLPYVHFEQFCGYCTGMLEYNSVIAYNAARPVQHVVLVNAVRQSCELVGKGKHELMSVMLRGFAFPRAYY